MTKIQKAIIIGSLLGDGYIYTNRYGSSYWEVKQQAKRRPYVDWLYEHFCAWCGRSPTYRSDTDQWRFITRTIPELTPWREIFYREGRKVVPRTLREMLWHPLSLAVWYMDDGSRDYRPNNHYAFTLSTNAFSDKEHQLLMETLLTNFLITSRVHKPKSRAALR